MAYWTTLFLNKISALNTSSCLTDIFSKPFSEAKDLTMRVHEEGRGIAGIYSREIAEQKIAETHACAQHYGHPLKAVAEQA